MGPGEMSGSSTFRKHIYYYYLLVLSFSPFLSSFKKALLCSMSVLVCYMTVHIVKTREMVI